MDGRGNSESTQQGFRGEIKNLKLLEIKEHLSLLNYIY